ncbi:DUF1963 domain-containing protein [Celerinatantimonas sp. MCCC 1A17872]|uniref:DUF1963 domain-containing protein n=1 Tax=Celerinatantimonas sp. MCCC 1A17872 TaxID=3177514 RepID=UPI0038CA20A6
MSTVYKLVCSDEKNSGAEFGGAPYINTDWPKNPDGEDLYNVINIDSNIINNHIGYDLLPTDTCISIFTTYSEEDYFLDDVTYFGDLDELDNIKSGYTKVIIKSLNKYATKDECKGRCINKNFTVSLIPYELKDGDIPAFSFFSSQIPAGVSGLDDLLSEYYFACQLYSGDIPICNGELFGLTDANGYLLIRKELKNDGYDGLFFIQTA